MLVSPPHEKETTALGALTRKPKDCGFSVDPQMLGRAQHQNSWKCRQEIYKIYAQCIKGMKKLIN